MTVDELTTHVFGDARSHLAEQCTAWMTASRRFKTFIEVNRDKLRKKARNAGDDAARLDLEAEVRTAVRLLQHRRFRVAWEPLAAALGRGPDFAIEVSTSLRFYVEVTRPRGAPGKAVGLANAVCAKLSQFPAREVNVLLLAGIDSGAADTAAVMHDLKRRAERRDNAFFERRGFDSARDFVTASHHLSAILLEDGGLWRNPEAVRPLPTSLATALTGLGAADV